MIERAVLTTDTAGEHHEVWGATYVDPDDDEALARLVSAPRARAERRAKACERALRFTAKRRTGEVVRLYEAACA